MADLTNKSRIHVSPSALAEKKPAIVVLRPSEQVQGLPLVRLASIRCRCGCIAATVEQHDDTAHVVLDDSSVVEVTA